MDTSDTQRAAVSSYTSMDDTAWAVGSFQVSQNRKEISIWDGKMEGEKNCHELVAESQIHMAHLLIQLTTHFDELSIIDATNVCTLPLLRSLNLSNVNVRKLRLTERMTPALWTLYLHGGENRERLEGQSGKAYSSPLKLDLALPGLKSLVIQSLRRIDNDALRHSLYKCTSLLDLHIRDSELIGMCRNHVILPTCKALLIENSTGFEEFEFVQAPMLKKIQLQSSVEKIDIRIWDIPQFVTLKELDELSDVACKSCQTYLRESEEWLKRWMDGTFTGYDANQIGLIPMEKAASFSPGTNQEDLYVIKLKICMNILNYHKTEREEAWQCFLKDLQTRPHVHLPMDMPANRTINLIGSISPECDHHFRTRHMNLQRLYYIP